MNKDQGRCEGILQQVLSVTHPVCLCDQCLLDAGFISLALSLSLSLFALSLTHTDSPPSSSRGDLELGCALAKKVTGVPIGNPKIKGPLFLLCVVIPCLCLPLFKLLTSAYDSQCRDNVQQKRDHFEICFPILCTYRLLGTAMA